MSKKIYLSSIHEHQKKYAIDNIRGDDVVTIARGVTISDTVLAGIRMGDHQALHVNGLVTGLSYGVWIGGEGSPGNTTVSSASSAVISGDDAGLAIWSDDNRVINAGKILGGAGCGILAHGAGTTILNGGTVSAHGVGISADGSFILSNTGSIFAATAIDGSNGRDVVANVGNIRGDVLLHAGDDVFVSTRGQVSGTIDGGDGNDRIYGSYKVNVLYGAAGSDSLHGNAMRDLLDGGEGNDKLYGAAGNDTGHGGAGSDVLDGGAGNDRLYGEAGSDTLKGGRNNDWLDGGDGKDFLDGGVGQDRLIGGAGEDRLQGGPGNDTLDGGAGRDRLVGGDGADTFVLHGGAGNADTIADFTKHATFDHIQLDSHVWKDLPLGRLDDTFFHSGTAAHDADDRIIYDVTTGQVFYDPDGSGAAQQELIVTLTNHAALIAYDFYVG